jgi:uncharacterized protein
MSILNLGDGLKLPLDCVTQTFAILAKRGVGKTHTASVMAEEMLQAGQPIVAIDPVGAMWGLRSKFPVVVFGGEHGDLPLEESAGETVARAIVQGRFPAVVDLSLFTKGQRMRFMVGFAENFYRLNREAVHLFVDEADDVAPQGRLYGGDESRMLGAMENIVRRGRKFGIGCTLITQRPQALAKSVLTQCECLVALRLVHPRDIDAIKEWVAVHGDVDTAKDMIASLPSLPIGEAWFWAPAWNDLFRRVKIRQRLTFDSGATPKPGEKAKAGPKLMPVDLSALGEQIKAAAEEAKANDPRELKRKIAELERQLREKIVPKAERVEVPVLTEYEKKLLIDVNERLAEFTGHMPKIVQASRLLQRLQDETRVDVCTEKPTRDPGAATAAPKSSPQLPSPGIPELHGAIATLPKAQRMILTALVQHGRASKSKVAVLTGYASNGGGFNNAVSWLRSQGYLEGRGDLLQATPAGIEALGPVEPLPRGKELIEQWCRDLPKAESLILRHLCHLYPHEITKEILAANVNYEPSGGGFNNALSRLRTLELIEGRGSLKASDALFA